MRYYLLQTTISGIKNIDKEVKIEYYNSIVSNELDVKNNHVKAIYGPNGAGKTGLMFAMQIYERLNVLPSYLTLMNGNDSLKMLVNQNTKELLVENIFAVIDNNNIKDKVYKHRIVLSWISDHFEITKEYYGLLSGDRINIDDKYHTIFDVEKGQIIKLDKNIGNQDKIIESTRNLLSEKTLLMALIEKDCFSFIDESSSIPFANLLFFILSMSVLTQKSDLPVTNLQKIRSAINQLESDNRISGNEYLLSLSSGEIDGNFTTSIRKEQLDLYLKKINNITSFLKVFKDDLQTIEVKTYEKGDFYECENVLVYHDGRRIDVRFESTGIKKIIELYDALCRVEKGGIVFIDEFDANLHDVLLVKIIEYIMEYSKGQFIFTTHNMAPMDILQYKKHGIDFLSPDSKLVSWKKNGNYKARSLYTQGYIDYSPFNIEAFSFLGKFGVEK